MEEGLAHLAPYARIAAIYRKKIESGELPVGARLPSHVEMRELHGVSKATVEKAVRTLREQGLVRATPGIGSRVVGMPLPVSSGTERTDRGRRTGSSWGNGESSDSHTAELVKAPADVAQNLGIDEGSRVVRRTRVYRDTHGIIAHSTSWIPREFAEAIPALLEPERLRGGTSLNVIAQKTGRVAVKREETQASRLADASDRLKLGLEPDTVAAILVLTSLFLDADEVPIEYGVDLGAPGRIRKETSEVVL
ncbi:GntR family transcriptional regulator (plasmid) [Streptomyces sp. SDT5-1]|uniref:GntR family transcriptional regulator n=1 Tax=Streptomyces sp. SDT5-1 TaxID=3406418 RepID=UPI003FD3474E